MQSPLVTVVTPSYNQAPFIRATIDSVLSQDYPYLEYIIMDGGSTDGTAGIVTEYASRLTWISEPDRGQSHAINKGFRLAKGTILSWLNSDDIILSGAVSKAVRALETDTELGAVYGEGYQIDRDGHLKCRFPWTEPFNLWKLVYVLDYILQQTVYFRKTALETVGYVDESLHWGMDWDILIRIGKCFPIGYIPEPMASIREYEEAKSFSGGLERFRELAALLRRHGRMRFPPAYFFYGLDTYQQIIRRQIDKLTPEFLTAPSARLQAYIAGAATFCIRRVYTHSQGWYSDGWATTRVRYLIPPPRGKRVVVRGSLPDLGGILPEQSIRIFGENKEIAQETFAAGNFCLDLSIPPQMRDGPVHLELKAARYFVPHSPGRSDGRKLSYILHGIFCERNL